ncbi:unnamed protein product [Mytilus edulis]|uniref:B box-type domain-containing protein n=1 Tax=Mytilus edulis TaxID=6550 RepID=A0A8S3VIR4_MYTED|nr:unnamed protein product [Mytilus edulis]
MAQSASKSCDICMSGPGRNYCEQCDQWMCENYKIAKRHRKVPARCKEAIRDITDEGNQLKQWIDKKVQALVSSLQDNEAESLRALRSINIVFQNDMEILLKCQHAFTDSQKITDVTYLLTKLKHIESELDVVDEKQSLVMPTVKYNKKNVSERDMIDLFGDPSFQEISYCIEKVLQKKTRYVHETEWYGIFTINIEQHMTIEEMSSPVV